MDLIKRASKTEAALVVVFTLLIQGDLQSVTAATAEQLMMTVAVAGRTATGHADGQMASGDQREDKHSDKCRKEMVIKFRCGDEVSTTSAADASNRCAICLAGKGEKNW